MENGIEGELSFQRRSWRPDGIKPNPAQVSMANKMNSYFKGEDTCFGSEPQLISLTFHFLLNL